MAIKKYLLIVILISIIPAQSMADDTHERIYLMQILNQLDALKPLIFSAKKEQNKNSRVKFHYQAFHDVRGKAHNGLLEDINLITNGIQSKLGKPSIESNHFQEISGDYLDSNLITSYSIKNAR